MRPLGVITNNIKELLCCIIVTLQGEEGERAGEGRPMEESSTEKKYDHEKSNIPAARKADDFDRQNDSLSSACASLSWLIIRIRP